MQHLPFEDIRNITGMIIPVWYPESTPPGEMEALLLSCVRDACAFAAPEHVMVVVDGAPAALAGLWIVCASAFDPDPLDIHPERHQHQVIIDFPVYTCYHGVAGPLAISGFPVSEACDHQSSVVEQSPLGRADWSIIT